MTLMNSASVTTMWSSQVLASSTASPPSWEFWTSLDHRTWAPRNVCKFQRLKTVRLHIMNDIDRLSPTTFFASSDLQHPVEWRRLGKKNLHNFLQSKAIQHMSAGPNKNKMSLWMKRVSFHRFLRFEKCWHTNQCSQRAILLMEEILGTS